MERNTPLVTVGLPMYNPGRFLDLAVRSVFAQTYDNWELIVVDDGSTDGSLDQVRRISDPRVKVFSDGQNRGLPYRLNQIIELASGVFIARMDADDGMHPKRLAEQVAFLMAHPDVDGVTSGAVLLDAEDNPTGLLPGIAPSVVEILSRGGYLHPSLVVRRKWALKYRYSEEYPRAEDRELFVRTYMVSKISVLDSYLYFYRWFGLPRTHALIAGYQSERRIIKVYGPKLVGWSATLRLLLRSYLKEQATKIGGLLGKDRFLRRRAFRELTLEEKQWAESALSLIKATRVPGWDE